MVQEDTYFDEMLGYTLAAAGFYTQFIWGFALPFPLNLIMFPSGPHMVHSHTVHLPLGALLSPCTMCGTGSPSPRSSGTSAGRSPPPRREARAVHVESWRVRAARGGAHEMRAWVRGLVCGREVPVLAEVAQVEGCG